MRSRRGDWPRRPTKRRPSRPPMPPPRGQPRRPLPRTRRRPTRKPTGSFSDPSTSSGALRDVVADGASARTRPGSAGKADFVLVLKAPRRLLLLHGDRVLRDYEIALGRNPAGPKRHQGDARTPEGRYRIDGRVADSRFHPALPISYPNEDAP